jgi:hypothetical protein
VWWLCDLRRHCGVTQKPCGAALVADHSGRICLAQRRGQRPLIPSGATPTDGWHGPACTQPCWAWSHSAIAVGAGQPARSRNPRLRWRDRLLSVGPPHRTDAIGARSTIDEVRDRLRIMVGLTKIRAPGAQTGRSVALEIKISACPVSGGMGADRDGTHRNRAIAKPSTISSTHDVHGAASTVDRMHRRTRYRGAVCARTCRCHPLGIA